MRRYTDLKNKWEEEKKKNERWLIKLISNGALLFFVVAVVWTPNFTYINYALSLPIKLISRGHILSDYFLYFKLFVVIVFSYGVLKLLGRFCRLFGSYNVQGINLRSCARRIPNLHQQKKNCEWNNFTKLLFLIIKVLKIVINK